MSEPNLSIDGSLFSDAPSAAIFKFPPESDNYIGAEFVAYRFADMGISDVKLNFGFDGPIETMEDRSYVSQFKWNGTTYQSISRYVEGKEHHIGYVNNESLSYFKSGFYCPACTRSDLPSNPFFQFNHYENYKAEKGDYVLSWSFDEDGKDFYFLSWKIDNVDDVDYTPFDLPIKISNGKPTQIDKGQYVKGDIDPLLDSLTSVGKQFYLKHIDSPLSADKGWRALIFQIALQLEIADQQVYSVFSQSAFGVDFMDDARAIYRGTDSNTWLTSGYLTKVESYQRFLIFLKWFNPWYKEHIKAINDGYDFNDTEILYHALEYFPSPFIETFSVERKWTLLRHLISAGDFGFTTGTKHYNAPYEDTLYRLGSKKGVLRVNALAKLLGAFAVETQNIIDGVLDYMHKEKFQYKEESPGIPWVFDKVWNECSGFLYTNMREFVATLYDLWLRSSYNPYPSATLCDTNVLDSYNYDPVMSPVKIEYEIEGFYEHFIKGDVDFKFDYKHTELKIEVTRMVNPNYDEDIGTYSLVQPVTIMGLDPQIVLARTGVHLQAHGSMLPIFVVKLIDQVGENEQNRKYLAAALDIALTLTGVGNAFKFRHMKHLGKLFKLGSLAPGETLLAWKAAQTFSETFSFTAGATKLLFDFYYALDPCDETDQDCKDLKEKIDNVLLLLELGGLGSHLLSRKALTKSVDDLVKTNKFDDIPLGTRTELLSNTSLATQIHTRLLDEWDGVYDNVLDKFDSLGLSDADELAFMFDFATDVKYIGRDLHEVDLMVKLNSKPQWIDNWVLLRNYPSYRKDPKILRSFEDVKRVGQYTSQVRPTPIGRLTPGHPVPKRGQEGDIAYYQQYFKQSGYDLSKPVTAIELPDEELTWLVINGNHRLESMKTIDQVLVPLDKMTIDEAIESGVYTKAMLAETIEVARLTGTYKGSFSLAQEFPYPEGIHERAREFVLFNF